MSGLTDLSKMEKLDCWGDGWGRRVVIEDEGVRLYGPIAGGSQVVYLGRDAAVKIAAQILSRFAE